MKFALDVPCLVSGAPSSATMAVHEFLRVPPEAMSKKYSDPLGAIREEFRQVFRAEPDVAKAKQGEELLTYILDEPAREVQEHSNDGHSLVVRDIGHAGMTLHHFALMKEAQQAALSVAEIAALRIYTSALFQYINLPFRLPENRHGFEKPHPCGLTVTFIQDGLKKLRKHHAGRNEKVYFWRGMKDLCIPSDFEERGGTELQCMSTTADIEIAGHYGQSKTPLIFCVHSTSFMNRGVDISWLSLYGHEKEILYPPLTYLRFLGKRKIQDCDNGVVVDVEPSMN